MKILDLFCGTKSISHAFEARGHEVFTVDWNSSFNPTLCTDIGTLTKNDLIELCGGVFDVENKIIRLVLVIDTKISSIMDYFEIFLERMTMCRRAATRLGLSFKLTINNQNFI